MKIKNFLMYIWQLPQNVVGLIVKKICKATPYATYHGANIYSWKRRDGISLGNYIFVPFKDEDLLEFRVQQYIKHEYGHTIQSKYLGWFYLIVIGLPSLVWAGCFKKYREKTGVSYYDFYTESSADSLGGVYKEN